MASIRQTVTLLGAGVQGTRLAYMWSRCGRPVYLIDKNQLQLDRAQREIEELRNTRASLGLSGNKKWGSLTFASSEMLEKAMLNSWLAIECVPESLSLKQSVVKQLDGIAAPETIIASNSSSYTITDIVKGLDLSAADRFVSLHSYWPPETSAIEVMGSGETRSEIISLLMKETAAHGFEPFHVRNPSMGYIYNRIWAAIKRETLLALDEGVATPEEIDGIFKAVLKTPKGPCEQMDVVGLDVVLDIEKHYAEVRPGLPEEPRKLLNEMVAQGLLGVKSGKGFFRHTDEREN